MPAARKRRRSPGCRPPSVHNITTPVSRGLGSSGQLSAQRRPLPPAQWGNVRLRGWPTAAAVEKSGFLGKMKTMWPPACGVERAEATASLKKMGTSGPAGGVSVPHNLKGPSLFFSKCNLAVGQGAHRARSSCPSRWLTAPLTPPFSARDPRILGPPLGLGRVYFRDVATTGVCTFGPRVVPRWGSGRGMEPRFWGAGPRAVPPVPGDHVLVQNPRVCIRQGSPENQN